MEDELVNLHWCVFVSVVHTEVLSDANVDFYAPLEAYMYSQATPSKIVRSFTQRLGGYFQKSKYLSTILEFVLV